MKTMMKKLGLVSLGALATPLAFAGGSGPDYSALTGAIDFEGIQPIVIGGAGALVALYVIIKGVRTVIGFVRS